MALWARADQNGEVIEVFDHPTDPTLLFDPDWTWIACPSETRQGSVQDKDGDWTHPPADEPSPEPPTPPRRTLVTRTEYYGLFTPVEEAMIRMVAAEPITAAAVGAAAEPEKTRLLGVAALAVMLARTDALGAADTIDLTNHQVQQGLTLLVSLGLLTVARRDEILLGVEA